MKDFERDIILEYLRHSPLDASIISNSNFEFEIYPLHAGYHLKLKNIGTEQKRIFLSKPEITGILDGIAVGFSVTIQDNYLVLECYSNSIEVTEKNRNGSFERTET